MTNRSGARIRFGVLTLQDAADYQTIKAHWIEAEKLGYDSCWLNDHLFGIPYYSWRAPMGDCYTRLGALAEATTTLRFGAMVTCQGFRNPALLTKMACTLDQISDGRFEFGVGAGNQQREHEAFGYNFPRPGARVTQLEETIQIYKKMMTEEMPSFEGKYYRIKECLNVPGPVQKPYPPVWVGGGGEKKTLRAVAKYANKWNSSSPPQDYAQKLKILEAHCDDVGRDYNEIEKTWWGFAFLDEDRNRLRAKVEPRATAANLTVDEFLAQRMAGNPDQFISKIREYIDLGVTYFVFTFGDTSDIASTQLFARSVMPAFR